MARKLSIFGSAPNEDPTAAINSSIVTQQDLIDLVAGTPGLAQSVQMDLEPEEDLDGDQFSNNAIELDSVGILCEEADGTVLFWFDINDSGTAEPASTADRSVEVTTAVTADNQFEAFAKMAAVINADSKFSSTAVNLGGAVNPGDESGVIITNSETGPFALPFFVNLNHLNPIQHGSNRTILQLGSDPSGTGALKLRMEITDTGSGVKGQIAVGLHDNADAEKEEAKSKGNGLEFPNSLVVDLSVAAASANTESPDTDKLIQWDISEDQFATGKIKMFCSGNLPEVNLRLYAKQGSNPEVVAFETNLSGTGHYENSISITIVNS